VARGGLRLFWRLLRLVTYPAQAGLSPSLTRIKSNVVRLETASQKVVGGEIRIEEGSFRGQSRGSRLQIFLKAGGKVELLF
jgi:hypothetical protein